MSDFRILRESARSDREWKVIEPIWSQLATPYEPDSRLRDLTPGQRGIYGLTWIHSEVCNGGFDQCFRNSTGYLLPEAIEGARTLGSEPWLSVMTRAADLFHLPYPRARERRQELLDRFTPEHRAAMARLDDELYDLDGEPATSLRTIFAEYIDAHPSEFFRDPANEVEAVEALLTSARALINSQSESERDLPLAQDLLDEAVRRSEAAGLDRTKRLAESLLVQLPDLRA